MKLADLLSRHGAMTSKGGQDTVPALINPREAMMLKMMGGSGRVDPQTGMLHFDNESDNGTNEGSGGGYGGAVTDSSGNTVTDSDGNAVGFGGYYDSGGLGDYNLHKDDPLYNYVSGWGSGGLSALAGATQAVVGSLDGVRETTQARNGWGEWANANPNLSNFLGAAAYLVNPALGLAYNVGTQASRGNNLGVVSTAANALGGPWAGLAVNTVGNLAEGRNANVVGSLIGAALNSSGNGWGQLAASQFNRGSVEQALAGNYANQAQGFGIGSALSSLGINNSGSGLTGSDYTGSGYNSDSGTSQSPGNSISSELTSSGNGTMAGILSMRYAGQPGQFNAYSTPYTAAQMSQMPYVNAPVSQTPQAIQSLLQNGQQSTSMYRQPRSLSSMLNTGDYYAD
jgi:hypothetical protein